LSIEEQGEIRKYRMTGTTMIAAVTGALGSEIEEAARDRLAKEGTEDREWVDRFGSAQLEWQLDG
jgi:hypothetical protein